MPTTGSYPWRGKARGVALWTCPRPPAALSRAGEGRRRYRRCRGFVAVSERRPSSPRRGSAGSAVCTSLACCHVGLPRRWAAAQAEMGGYGARRIEIGRPWASAHRKRHRGEGEGAGECTGGPSRREGVPAGRGRPHGEFARVEGQPGSLPAGQGDRQLARAAARCRAGLGRRRRRGAHCVTGGRSLESR